MGYLRRNNEMNTSISAGYHIFEPHWIYRETHFSAYWNYTRIYNPSDKFGNNIGVDWYTLFKNNYQFELYGNVETDRHDYYETRVKGRYFVNPLYWEIGTYMSTDQRKPVGFYFNLGRYTKPSNNESGIYGYPGINFRFGQRVQLSYNFGLNYAFNKPGFVDKTDNNDTIYFAKRDIKTIENVINFSYAITNKAGISFRMRHYWSGADSKSFYQLQQDGSFQPDLAYQQNQDKNFNSFNIDMVFRWIFAPGSELSLAWKNSILDQQDNVNTDFLNNLDNTFGADKVNSISLKVLYYLDYNQLRRKK